jgi:Kef-type K+ transport system membrane component KefB
VSDIESIICLILLFMAVPDFCRRIGRPALVYSVFVVLGVALGALVHEGVRAMLLQAGKVGFLLLLFEVGLEIDLPNLRASLKPLRFAALWSLAQYPIILGLARVLGVGWPEAFVASAALTACSVGMAHAAWKNYPGLADGPKRFLLEIMVILEMVAIVIISVEAVALHEGFGWMIVAKLLGIATAIFLISRFAARLTKLFQTVLARTAHWRLHIVVLVVLAVCALGERLGLPAAKTAFFLGLFMSRARHQGRSLEEYIAPISQRLLIPIFFVALGLQMSWRLLLTPVALVALGSAALLLGFRELLHRRWLKTGGDHRCFLLLCPNLTIVALAANELFENGGNPAFANGLILAGMFLTVASLLLLPRTPAAPVEPVEPEWRT